MADRLPFEEELVARIGWLVRLRWLATAGTAAAIGLTCALFPGRLAVAPLLAGTGAVALYNLEFVLHLRTLRISPSGDQRLRQATASAVVQIVLDLVALAFLLHFASGAENPLAVFFVFHIIIASILLPRVVSFLMAGLGGLLFAAVAGLEYWSVLPHYHLPFIPWELNREPFFLVAVVATMVTTLLLVAYLTTSITAKLRDRDRELVVSNLTCQVRSTELAALNEQLRRLDAERTRFLVLVTHELRSPVSTIYSALELVRAGYTDKKETDEVLGRAQRRASELLQLISELLDLVRVREQSARRETMRPIQIADSLREAAKFIQIEAERNGVALEVEIAPELGEVRAQPDQMKLVWTNLLSNAVKYNRPGGSVRVSLAQDEREVIGTVHDTGIGIPAEDLPRVFDEFYRAGNARLVSPHGTGVGLAIVRRILETLGGRIWVESEPGQGSRFAFALPRADRSS